MGLTEAQYDCIAPVLSRQRGNVRVSNRPVLNTIRYVAEQGGEWRGFPTQFRHWHPISTRMNRWTKHEVLDRVCEYLQREPLIRIKPEAVSLDGLSVEKLDMIFLGFLVFTLIFDALR